MVRNHCPASPGIAVRLDPDFAEDLEFYSARHTWATIATNDAGVDKLMVHTALNHVDQDMKVTDIYVRKSWDPIDKANRKVLDFVKLKIGNVAEPKKEKPESGIDNTI